MIKKKMVAYFKGKNKGQSLVEMTIILIVLLTLLTGMVEFGTLLNQYINITDGAREGARFGSNVDPFLITDDVAGKGTYVYPVPQDSFFKDIDTIIEGNLSQTDPTKRTSAIAPLVLDPTPGTRSDGQGYLPDDVLITFYAVSGKNIQGKYPTGGAWSAHKTSRVSLIPDSEIIDQLNSDAPPTGILLVEIFYNYHQILKSPFFTSGFIGIADPISLHSYAFMPLAGAEATPTP